MATWPGPAARLDGHGEVVQANQAASVLLDEVTARAGRDGLAALVTSVQDGPARTDTIVIARDRVSLTYDLWIVPLPGSSGGALLLARDVSLAANLRQALTESRQRFKDLVEISSDFAWETDAVGVFTFVSPKGALGWSAADFVGRPAASFIDDQDSKGASPFVTRTLIDQAELWLRRADGTPACVSISALPLIGADGAWRGARGVWRDVTEVHARDAALADAQMRERLVGYIVRTIRDEVEPDAMLTAAASAAARALGAAGCRIWGGSADGALLSAAEFGTALPSGAEALLAAHARRLKAETDAAGSASADEIEAALPGGHFLGAVTRFRRQINGAIGLWRQPAEPGWGESDRDIVTKIADQIGIAQEQIANHEALAKQARTDGLTGLLNRRSFTMRLEEGVADCQRTGQSGTLVYVDLDNFKAVNDRLGHPAGDAALKALAACLRRVARASDLVARLGGDEFALWLATADKEAAVGRAKAILALKDEIAAYSAGPDKPLGLSVGLAVYQPAGPETIAELLARADGAMYEVKRRGKGAYAVALTAAETRAGAANP
ncbi:MAG TPA: diguanylate cyclase [Alphaproteobacteria bacterium]